MENKVIHSAIQLELLPFYLNVKSKRYLMVAALPDAELARALAGKLRESGCAVRLQKVKKDDPHPIDIPGNYLVWARLLKGAT